MTSEQRPKQQEARDQTTWLPRLKGTQAEGRPSAKPLGSNTLARLKQPQGGQRVGGEERRVGGTTGGGAAGVMEGLTAQGRLWILIAVSRDITGGFCLVLKALWLLQCREAHQAGAEVTWADLVLALLQGGQ